VNCRTVPVSSWQLNDFYRPITWAMRNNDGIASVVMWYWPATQEKGQKV
jgi:hypothetical protein